MRAFYLTLALLTSFLLAIAPHVSAQDVAQSLGDKVEDAKNVTLDDSGVMEDPALAEFGIYEESAPRPQATEAIVTSLPLKLEKGTRIALIGNTLFDRMQHFGYFEAMLQEANPGLQLSVRNLSWSADEITLQPRPENFADTEQHLYHEKADVILAAYGYNESFEGEEGASAFREELTTWLEHLKTRAFNGESAAQIVLVSPVANEDVTGVRAGDLNNANIQLYTDIMRSVAKQQGVGFVDVFSETRKAMDVASTDLTFNGAHLTDPGYQLLSSLLFRGLFDTVPPAVDERIRELVVDKNRQYFRRFRPVNTFYYTGGRKKGYGYLDFLPAMRNFLVLTENREKAIWSLASGGEGNVDDSNLPEMPPTKLSRGANEWMSAADELKAFNVDPRFEVTLFAGEEEFPDIACPIQIRWDAQGRMWVACSTTYPHVYPGQEPNDKLVILEDTDGDGKADKSSVFADDLHIPLSFEFADGGVYVSEEPHLTFLKDTDGDGKADVRRMLMTGFGTEDSHHALHDFAWTPDGDLIFREAIFHHTQVETPYGPVRQANSGWFRYEPETHRLTSFGTYHSTNPWGVTFDKWGQHMASHPVYAAAFHALDPAYPEQHPRPAGLTAYSGTCGQEFIDFRNWPDEFQGMFVKARYKPTNRIELLRWNEYEFGFDEEYVGDLIFSTNLSFIPVDIRFGPRGGMYICDWYNPIKGHAQYSLRDPRRDRDSGRIWRLVPRDFEPQDPPKIAGASIAQLLENLKLPEYRYRYWSKRELREQDPDQVAAVLDTWLQGLDPETPSYRHHQLEALWVYSGIGKPASDLLQELLNCDVHLARAAATQQLRYWHGELENSTDLLSNAANDDSAIVRMQAAIAASWIGSEEALTTMLDTLDHPHEKHVSYAIRTSLGSEPLKQHWYGNEAFNAAYPELRDFYDNFEKSQKVQPTIRSANDSQFDAQKGLKKIVITCVKERMLFDITEFTVKPGQPIRLTLANPDATQHNLAIVQPGSVEEIGLAANEMAKDPSGIKKGFIPKSDKIIVHTKLLDPDSAETIRFHAPKKPGVYPYLCTFPGHWIIMKGEMTVKE